MLQNTIEGCPGGAECPLLRDVAANADIFATQRVAATPKMDLALPPSLLPFFSKQTCEIIVAVAGAPIGGREIDFGSAAFALPSACVRAAYAGWCTTEQAMLELQHRQEELTEESCTEAGVPIEVMAKRLSSAMELLKTSKDKAVAGSTGVLTYIWAKASTYFDSSSVARIGASSSRSSEVTATLRRPTSSTEFYELVQIFILVTAGLGLYYQTVLLTFFHESIFKLRHTMQLGWEVMHELVLVYFRRIDQDPTRTYNLGNVTKYGMLDSSVSEAKQNSAVFFRTRAGTAQPGSASSTKTWNGKCTAGAKPCAAFNNGNAHSGGALTADGTCIYDHVCNAFVKDKGQGGQCLGDHPRHACTYPAAKRCDKPWGRA